MATQPDTQPVLTPALTITLIRETLNPVPPVDAPPAVWAEYGYTNAMLDAVLTEAGYEPSGATDEIDPANWPFLVSEVTQTPEWATMYWADEAITILDEIAFVLEEADNSI
jgi:hypothetical protein